MNQYRALKKQNYVFQHYQLIPIRKQDIQLIKDWRNDQIDALRQEKPITSEQQAAYYNNIIKKSFNEDSPSLVLFSFLHNDLCIGYGGLTNIDWDRKNAEMSFLVDTDRASNPTTYENDFTAFLRLIHELTFDELGFTRLFTETYDIRPEHVSILEKNGFTLERRLERHKDVNGNMVDILIHSYVKGSKS